jgi:hypothetical protein
VKKIFNKLRSNRQSKLLSTYLVLIWVTTLVHHIYGALIYNSVWRIYFPLFVFPVILILTLFLQYLFLSKKRKSFKITFILFVAFFWILLVGIIEGGYGHLLKNILNWLAYPKAKLETMFPPEFGNQSFFEQPNDWFFEISGISQLILGIFILYYLTKLTKRRN